MTRSGWTAPVVVADKAVSTWGSVPTVWTSASAGETLYGWFAYNFATMKLMIAERFDTARPVGMGSVVSLLPRFTGETFVPCP